ncbi:MAG: DtxR family transcriptional regulator, Mn-dependent transcriptional regulator [Actinomycetota bacterium]|nr:DtxR family transcriptional regulator, Mn-dependent transcriptional regulator [Actinomycetota bacterium]
MPKLKVGKRRTSAAQEDYLKALFRISGRAETLVPNARLAEEMGVSPGSVSEMLGKLAALGLIVHDPYRGARLTPDGLKVAVEMIRHHRLIETYLVRALGYGWDEVHEEADRLEHAISERLEERMWQALGQPAFDPHGDPIPAPDGTLVEHPTLPLQSAPAGSEVTVSRISDRDPAKLRAVERLGLTPGRRVMVVEESVWESPIVVSLDGSQISVPLGLARAIRVEGDAEGGTKPPG